MRASAFSSKKMVGGKATQSLFARNGQAGTCSMTFAEILYICKAIISPMKKTIGISFGPYRHWCRRCGDLSR